MGRTYIIAEAGVNHNGDFELAKMMILEGKKAGVDAVKFQTFKAGNLVSSNAKKADYQMKSTDNKESQQDMLKKLELSFREFCLLKEYAAELNIDFISTPFDEESVDFLNSLNMPFWKIPSGEITNLPYLLKIAKTKKPIILSTGMCTLQEIEEALNIFGDYNREDITVLHCNTEYPTPFKDVNLNAMKTLEKKFHVKVGYSDHTQGFEVPVAAVALGAVVIEKHFTLDKNMPGPDHKASLEPDELKEMVKAIRNIETALGNGEKHPSESEKKNIAVARKSIVAKKDIKKGDIFTEENITTKRPGNGISPMEWFRVLGRKAKKDFQKDELIER
ncbi:N-acetylneuraminate synthase [Anaerocolumna aminovalerica]|jgi:N,N'-diacetyllegionaminate synthase|uniref:N-acetylneuraminate synthase n=1 Tax=Anaerocolumna aminovalerica TaxID=1527 RepID=A0A1I5DLT2_9FIRM|nr:N-acetylneuraminate synthase [Anaerocolumna aminovalerica]MBU5332233.1 N-acetylneuraminate synthase [Anaerocolumna aminovalerica]MDU6263937.1 N-acetylneuraminate synthase [Anaerocolumna aminovalerica]SFO00235.1 N-acetylneuraminate synthase [Anaerocolumna aminovalerica]